MNHGKHLQILTAYFLSRDDDAPPSARAQMAEKSCRAFVMFDFNQCILGGKQAPLCVLHFSIFSTFSMPCVSAVGETVWA